MDVFDMMIYVVYGIVGAYYIALVAAVIGMYRRIKARRWHSCASLGVGLMALVVPGFLLNLLPGSIIFNDLIHSRRLTGTCFLMGSPILHYDSERSFHGDGHSIYVYSLSTSAANSFKEPSKSFFNAYPQRPWYRNDWQTRNWSRVPAIKDDLKLVEFGLSRFQPSLQLERALDEARESLQKTDSFYSFHYKGTLDFPNNIDLFILSPSLKRLIWINLNT